MKERPRGEKRVEMKGFLLFLSLVQKLNFRGPARSFSVHTLKWEERKTKKKKEKEAFHRVIVAPGPVGILQRSRKNQCFFFSVFFL